MISFLGSIVLPHRLKNLLGCEGTDVPFKLLLPVEVAPLIQLARESPRNCPVVCQASCVACKGLLGRERACSTDRKANYDTQEQQDNG